MPFPTELAPADLDGLIAHFENTDFRGGEEIAELQVEMARWLTSPEGYGLVAARGSQAEVGIVVNGNAEDPRDAGRRVLIRIVRLAIGGAYECIDGGVIVDDGEHMDHIAFIESNDQGSSTEGGRYDGTPGEYGKAREEFDEGRMNPRRGHLGGEFDPDRRAAVARDIARLLRTGTVNTDATRAHDSQERLAKRKPLMHPITRHG